ncbi:MAG: hypothetical protein KAU14_01660 [Thermoplasmata archaeon]|nr:hypothetical protein [Thermoplasmata archaeon]
MNKKTSPTTLPVLSLLLVLLLLTLSIVIPSAAAILPRNEFHVMCVDETIRNNRPGGFEPHILAGPSYDNTGEWYYYDSPSGLVTGGVGPRIPGNLWISKDNGNTWQFYDKSTIPGLGASGDSFTAITRDGTIFYTDLYLATASVDTSLDGGRTWYANPVASQYVMEDRQWLDIGPSRDGIGDETLYFAFNQLTPPQLVMVKAGITTGTVVDSYSWRPCNGGAPIATDVSARDVFCIDEESGNIYIANYAEIGEVLEVFVSTNGGNTFTHYTVTNGQRPEIQNIFVAIDTDAAGNVYLAWSSRDHIWLGVSTDHARSWTIHQVTQTKSVKVFPWVSAGDEGRVGLGWYESEIGDEGSPDEQTESWWDLKAAITLNALNETPNFEIITVDEDVHFGGVQTTGTGGGSDRDLGDFMTVDVDSHGRLLVSYGEDGDDGPNSRMAYPMYACQIDGPFLRENKGPEIDYELGKSDRKVHLELDDVHDQENLTIINITIDWGDGSPWESLDEELSLTHKYPDRDARYNLTIQATNEMGMRTTAVVQVNIDEDEGWEIAGMPGWVVVGTPLLILLTVGAVYLCGKRREKQNR